MDQDHEIYHILSIMDHGKIPRPSQELLGVIRPPMSELASAEGLAPLEGSHWELQLEGSFCQEFLFAFTITSLSLKVT